MKEHGVYSVEVSFNFRPFHFPGSRDVQPVGGGILGLRFLLACYATVTSPAILLTNRVQLEEKIERKAASPDGCHGNGKVRGKMSAEPSKWITHLMVSGK